MFGLTNHDSILVIVTLLAASVVFNCALYFGQGRKKVYLFFAFYCAFHIFKFWLKTWPDFVIFGSFTNHDLILLSMTSGLFMLNVFLAHYLDVWFKKHTLLLAVVFLMALMLVANPHDFIIYGAVGLALIQTGMAFKKSRYARVFLLGVLSLLISLILGKLGFFDYGYFTGTLLMVFVMTIATSMRLSNDAALLNRARRRSVQLENQLLKKSIQPHFVLNSLTSLQELIELNPKAASTFIQELSEEFKLFSRVSQQPLIPLKEELSLMRVHLSIMSTRLNKQFSLTLDGLDEDAKVPPGIFLTLIENGITHGFEDTRVGVFQLSRIQSGSVEEYRIANDGKAPELPINEGLGLKFVRTRLEETYQNGFQLLYRSLNPGFETTIRISR